MKKIIQSAVLSMAAGSIAIAGGYKIPEQSLNSMALGAAYVAHTTGADTAYYNPANMSFMGDKSYVEGAVTLAHLPSIEYTSDYSSALDGKSKVENILIPNLHYVSKPMGDFRWGVSLTAPGGLSKRWEDAYQKASAEEFTLKVIELNPSVSYKLSDTLSIGGGVRVVYSEGIVKSNSAEANATLAYPYNIARDMEGDTVEFGYNLALAYRPTNDIQIGITYRSKIDLNEAGTAILSYNGTADPVYEADVTVPLPAALNIALAKTWNDTFTLEFNYERTYWSSYETLDFNYNSTISNPILYAAFDLPKDKNWKDTDTFRVGATYHYNDSLTLMAGFAIDESPAPVETIGFELPDSDAKIYSAGFRYRQNENLSWGAAVLYDDKESRTVDGGVFSKGGAILTTIGVAYEY